MKIANGGAVWPVRMLLCGLIVALGGCGEPRPSGEDPEATPPEATEAAAAHPDAVWFEVLGISTKGGPPPEVVTVTDPRTLAKVWEDSRFDGALPAVDWEQHIVLVLRRTEDACPDELVEVLLADGVMTFTWLPPVGGCAQPAIPTAYAVLLHRGHLPERFTARLTEFADEHDQPVELPPYDGPAAPPPPAPPRQMGAAEADAVFAGHALQRCPPQPRHRSEPKVDGPLSDEAEVADIQRRRAEFALPSDEATARRLRDDTRANQSFGFPMTETEFDELMNRNRPEFSGRLHEEYLSKHAGTWGFSLVDQPAGGVFVIGFTGDLEGHRARLAELFPDVAIRVVQAAATQEELSQAQTLLHERFPYGGRPRITGSGSGTDQLEISVVDPSREDLDAIAAVVDPAIACIRPELSGLPR